jgi:cell division septum initiation protein DivIVA
VQSKHGGEVEEIVQRTYKEVKEATKKGVDMQSATKVWQILEKSITDLGELAKDSAGEILDQHPQIKEKVGGNIDQLKQMADQYGPEAKKELDDVYKRISDMVKGGVGVGSIEELRKLVEEKMEKVRKLGDEAWKKGLEQAKPYLDKNPKIKEIVESNASALKSGNITELFQQVKEAASSGNTDKLQEYVKQAGEKAKNSGMGQSIEQYAKMIPGGSEILPKLQKLQEVARKKGDDAERILKGAYEDVQEVLQKRIKEAEKLADEAGKEAKN